MMRILDELKAQRERIAGKTGFRWVKRAPYYRPQRCCMVAWSDDKGNTGGLSSRARLPLNREIFKRFGIVASFGDDVAVFFNDRDRRATRSEVLDIFDTVIAKMEV